MHYLPNLSLKEQMLSDIGLGLIDDLYTDVPESVRIDGLDMDDPLSELEVKRKIDTILARNTTVEQMPGFMGAGVYNHFIPPVVRSVLSRGELFTSYTPYQPEISQGILQALFEYQSMATELMGMDAANSSMYDYSTAVGEATLMAFRHTRKGTILVSESIHWNKFRILDNYLKWRDLKVKTIPYDRTTGQMDLKALEAAFDDDTAGVYVESPNLFGLYETELPAIRSMIDERTGGKGLLIIGTNPLSVGITKTPGEMGADIAIGEGQIFGNPMNYGGPLVGMFTCKKAFIRKMPGRIIGLTKDADGRQAFCMTLQTREQHIRREKATSNICSNEALSAVASLVHIAALGRTGLEQAARMNATMAKRLAGRIDRVDGFKAPALGTYFFNEFVVSCPAPVSEVNEHLLKNGVMGGIDLTGRFDGIGNAMLVTTTEMHTLKDHDRLVAALSGFGGGA